MYFFQHQYSMLLWESLGTVMCRTHHELSNMWCRHRVNPMWFFATSSCRHTKLIQIDSSLFEQLLAARGSTLPANLVHVAVFLAVKCTGRQALPTRAFANPGPAVVAHINVILLGHTMYHFRTLLSTLGTRRQLALKANLVYVSPFFLTAKRTRWQTSVSWVVNQPFECWSDCSFPISHWAVRTASVQIFDC